MSGAAQRPTFAQDTPSSNLRTTAPRLHFRAPAEDAVDSSRRRGRASRADALRMVREALPKLLLRQSLPLAVAVGMVWLLCQRLAQVDGAAIMAAFVSVSLLWWSAALVLTASSFYAVGQYDAVINRVLVTGVPARVARYSGIAAIAISQTLGLGLVTGGLVRWRLLPGFSLWQATGLSATVGLSFLAGWGVVTSCVVLVLPPRLPGLWIAACGVLTLAGLLVLACLWRPRIAGRSLPRIPLLAVARIIGFAALDTGAAMLAFWCLLPATAGLGLAELSPAFLLALGAGLLSGTPGGVGPFEMVLLLLLPQVPEAPLLAAVVAFRLVYYALPAVIGGAMLVAGPRKTAPRPQRLLPPGTLGPDLAALLASAARAESQLLHHGEHSLLLCAQGRAGWQVARTGQALVAFSDPFAQIDPAHPRPDLPDLLAALETEADAADRVVCLYKCGGRTALAARQAGYRVLPITCEVWVSPGTFRLDTPARSQLRRKLRKAQKAGLRIEAGGPGLPIAEMTAISDAWVARHGGERGFSMGRYAPEHLALQRVYLARDRSGALVAFLTLHQARREWALDLMRYGAGMPDGAMHALLHQAICDAAAQGVPRLSLAAVPRPPAPNEPALLRLLHRRIDRASGAAGLRQFKASFAPHWEPLYMAAPGWGAMALAGVDIFRGICTPLPRSSRRRHRTPGLSL